MVGILGEGIEIQVAERARPYGTVEAAQAGPF
jgi:hypothetical protein